MFTELSPSADPRLAAVLAAARAPAELPLPGEAAALTAYRTGQGKSWFRLGNRSAHLIAASLFSGVVFAGSVAAAASGAMPLPIVGAHHQASAPAADSTDATTATSSTESTGTGDMADSAGPGASGHPAAQPIVPGSVAKGAATCATASHDTCQAGRHGKAAAAHSHRAGHAARPAAAGHATVHRPAAVPVHGLATDLVHPHTFRLRRTHVSG